MEVSLSDDLQDSYDGRKLALYQSLITNEDALERVSKKLESANLNFHTYNTEIDKQKIIFDHAKSFVRAFSPVVDDMQAQINEIDNRISIAKHQKINDDYTNEMQFNEISALKAEKEPIVKKRDLFLNQLKQYIANRDKAKTIIDNYTPLKEDSLKEATDLAEQKRLIERALTRVKYNTKKLKTEYIEKSIISRADVNRLLDADCFIVIPNKLLFKFWDEQSHYLDGNYALYSNIDIMEVTEEMILEGRVVSIGTKFYRGVREDYLKTGADYLKIDFSNDGEGRVRRSVNEFAVNLNNLFVNLKDPTNEDNYINSKNMLISLLEHKPQYVANLPLYIFDSNELITLVRNSIKEACAIIVTNYKKNNKGATINKELALYMQNLGKSLQAREKQATEYWKKIKNET